jgi:hypothetical protein
MPRTEDVGVAQDQKGKNRVPRGKKPQVSFSLGLQSTKMPLKLSNYSEARQPSRARSMHFPHLYFPCILQVHEIAERVLSPPKKGRPEVNLPVAPLKLFSSLKSEYFDWR